MISFFFAKDFVANGFINFSFLRIPGHVRDIFDSILDLWAVAGKCETLQDGEPEHILDKYNDFFFKFPQRKWIDPIKFRQCKLRLSEINEFGFPVLRRTI